LPLTASCAGGPGEHPAKGSTRTDVRNASTAPTQIAWGGAGTVPKSVSSRKRSGTMQYARRAEGPRRRPLVIGCPDEATLVEFAEGALGAVAAGRVEQHADACTECRRALAELGKAAPDALTAAVAASTRRSSPSSAPSALMDALMRLALAPGDVIAARYRIE